MTESLQSVNYQDTDLEGDSIRDIKDTGGRGGGGKCVYVSCLISLLAGWGLGYLIVFPSLSLLSQNQKSSHVPPTLPPLYLWFFFFQLLSHFVISKTSRCFFSENDLFSWISSLARPSSQPQPTLKILFLLFHSQIKYAITPFE